MEDITDASMQIWHAKEICFGAVGKSESISS